MAVDITFLKLTIHLPDYMISKSGRLQYKLCYALEISAYSQAPERGPMKGGNVNTPVSLPSAAFPSGPYQQITFKQYYHY
jgi:hypothetical protein